MPIKINIPGNLFEKLFRRNLNEHMDRDCDFFILAVSKTGGATEEQIRSSLQQLEIALRESGRYIVGWEKLNRRPRDVDFTL